MQDLSRSIHAKRPLQSSAMTFLSSTLASRKTPPYRVASSVAFTLVLLLAGADALAARPFVTDDARLTTARSCQLESWMRVYPQSRELWALPACNPGGNFEVTAGTGHARNEALGDSNDYLVQFKTLARTIERDGFGLGFALGRVAHPSVNPGPNLFGNTYAYVPLTYVSPDERLVVHGNLGWLRDRATRADRLTWGVGGEYVINARVSAIAETFGDDHSSPFWQTGLRTFIVPGKVQIDATCGGQSGGNRDGRWLSFGLRLTPDRLF